MKLAQRLQVIKPSPTLEITAKIAAMRSDGINIIGFGAGEPDFDTPANIKQAGIAAIEAGHTRYTPVGGIPSLKDAVIARLQRDAGLSYSRDEILVSCGAKHSLYNAAMALFDEGDEVIIPSPYWVSYPEIVAITGATPVIVPTEHNKFILSEHDFINAITPQTKAVTLNYPSNPTGATYTKEHLEKLGRIAVEKNIIIISDEIYDGILFTDTPHTSVASLGDAIKNNTVYINGLSKLYAMTGWRIGYTAARKELIKGMNTIQSQSTSNPTSISQYAGVEALNGSQDAPKQMLEEFKKRKNYIVPRLNAMTGVTCSEPDGSFYAFPDVSGCYGKKFGNFSIKDSLTLTDFLLQEAEIGVIPGIAFGSDAHLRFSFATSMDNLELGMDRMESTLKKLQ